MLRDAITSAEIKKIFGNKEKKIEYLKMLFQGENNAHIIEKSDKKLDNQIETTWSYELSKKIIRELFKLSPKYFEQKNCRDKIEKAIAEWNELGLGDFEWPFSARSFDQHVHILNRRCDCSEKEKDLILSKEIIKFRRIKHINALRNDYIEYLIFKNENVIPTFGNKKGVDFYINGEPYDQKVGKSVGKAFIEQYGENYREIAINHPELVAKSLYENQDEERFGDEARLFIVYLDSNVDSNNIELQLSSMNFDKPYEVKFNYKHSNNVTIEHKSNCFVILLHN